MYEDEEPAPSKSETKKDIDKTLSLGFQETRVCECVKCSVWSPEWMQITLVWCSEYNNFFLNAIYEYDFFNF